MRAFSRAGGPESPEGFGAPPRDNLPSMANSFAEGVVDARLRQGPAALVKAEVQDIQGIMGWSGKDNLRHGLVTESTKKKSLLVPSIAPGTKQIGVGLPLGRRQRLSTWADKEGVEGLRCPAPPH